MRLRFAMTKFEQKSPLAIRKISRMTIGGMDSSQGVSFSIKSRT